MKRRVKKKETTLFFDSFKHFKNNLSNLVCMELITLMDSKDLISYAQMKSVNYKSKMPDMKKFGLIDYDKPSDNKFSLTKQGKVIYSVFEKYKSNFHYEIDNERLESIKPKELWELLLDKEKQTVTENLITLLISYYDTADSIRPYLALIKIIEEYNIQKIDNNILYNILSQTKANILMKTIVDGSFDLLDVETQQELKRPISYIINELETSGIIDENGLVVYDRELVKEIVMNLNEIYLQIEYDKSDAEEYGRSAEEQRNFRNSVLAAYGYKCAITGKCIEVTNIDNTTQYLLDAAHIIPYSESGSFSVNNGIALSFEMHKLFDRKLFAFKYNNDGNIEIVVSNSKRIKDDEILKEINHKIIRLPQNQDSYPDKSALEYRFKQHLLA